MEVVRLCSARSESLRRTFLDRVSKADGLHSKSLRPCPGRCVETLGAFRLRLRLKPLSWVDGSFLRRGPQRPAFLRVPRGEVRSLLLCPTRMPVRLVSLPLLPDNPVNCVHSGPERREFLWQSSLVRVMGIKRGLADVLWRQSREF